MESYLQGRSLTPLLQDTNSPDWTRATAFSISRSGGESLRTYDYRFTQWGFGDRGMELYDLHRDPGEFQNQATNPEYADVVKELKQQLLARRNAAGFQQNEAAIRATVKLKKK